MSALGEVGFAFLKSRLGRRFLIALIASLTASSLVFLAIFVAVYRDRLIEEHARASAQVNELLEASLKNAMLKRDLDGLKGIVAELGREGDIASVMILDPGGEVRFASKEALVGQDFRALAGGGGSLAEPSAAFITNGDGAEVLRTVNPVRNEERCKGCHGPASEHPVNGILVVDYAAGAIHRDALLGTLVMAAAGGIVLIGALLSVAALLFRDVLRPVRQLAEATGRFTEGDLGERVAIAGSTEMSLLGERFNHMADRLGATIDSLKASERFLQAVIDAVPDGVRVIAEDFTVLKVNRSYCAQLGIAPADAIGRSCFASSHHLKEPCSPTLVTCPVVDLRSGDAPPLKCRHRHIRADGRELFVEVSAARAELTIDGQRRACIIESIRDLAEQATISHEQRLSEIGQLATGIAHEIHNPLASIHLALRAMRDEIAEKGSATDIDDYLEIADHEINRCIDVTSRLLRLSEPAEANAVLVDVRRVVEEVIALLRYQAQQAHVAIRLDIHGAPRLFAAESDLGILVLNLGQNAIHAMPGGGALTIRVATEGATVRMTFADTGVGIEEENLKRIFWPFWSRRADGSTGSGLGLAICRATVDRLGGAISVESKPGRGTTFTVTLANADWEVDAA